LGWTNQVFRETSRSAEPALLSAPARAARGRRPSVCGFRPPPLASPGKGRSVQHPRRPGCASTACAAVRLPIGRTSIRCPGLRELAFAAALPPNFDSPTDSRDHFARSGAFQRPAPSMRPSAPGPSPPSSSPCGSDWASNFTSASRRCSGTRRSLVSPGEAGGSPWLPDHFDTALQADNRGRPKACARTGARPVHNLGKPSLFSPETEGIQRVPGYPQVPGAMLNAPESTRQRFPLLLELQPFLFGRGELGAGLVEVGHQPVEAGLVPGVEPRVVEALF